MASHHTTYYSYTYSFNLKFEYLDDKENVWNPIQLRVAKMLTTSTGSLVVTFGPWSKMKWTKFELERIRNFTMTIDHKAYGRNKFEVI